MGALVAPLFTQELYVRAYKTRIRKNVSVQLRDGSTLEGVLLSAKHGVFTLGNVVYFDPDSTTPQGHTVYGESLIDQAFVKFISDIPPAPPTAAR